MTAVTVRCARCDGADAPLRRTSRWGSVCPACARLHDRTFRTQSAAERLGIALVLAGLTLWAAYLALVVLNLFF